VVRVCATPADRTGLLTILSLWSIPTSVFGILQVAGAPGVPGILDFLTHSLAVRQRIANGDLTRASSFIGHWTSLGGYLVVVILMACAAYLDSARTGTRPRSMLVVIGFALAALAATLTYAPAVVGLLAVLFFALRDRALRRYVPLAAAVIAAAGAGFSAVLTTRLNQQFQRSVGTSYGYGPAWMPKSLQFRYEVWVQQMIPAFRLRELTGWGHSRFPAFVTWPYYESSYIEALVSGGLVEFGLMIALMLAMFRVGFRATRGPETTAVGAAAVFGVFSIAVLMTVHPHFNDVGMPLALWCLLGAAASATNGWAAQPAPAVRRPGSRSSGRRADGRWTTPRVEPRR
jgi:hypothetical protein